MTIALIIFGAALGIFVIAIITTLLQLNR